MKAIFQILCGLMFFMTLSCASSGGKKESKVTVSEIKFEVDGQAYNAYTASGVKSGEKKPGIIIVHEWWGQTEFVKQKADELAKLGYVAMAIDMYGEGKTAEHPREAMEFSKKAMSDFPAAQKRFEKAVTMLKSRDDVDETKVVAIGFCFGGSVILNMTFAGSDLDLVASFHGSLSKDMKVSVKKENFPKVLIFNGADDTFVTDEQIEHVKNLLTKNNISYVFESYAGAKHAFTNMKADEYAQKFDLPLAYSEIATQKSWAQFLEELRELEKPTKTVQMTEVTTIEDSEKKTTEKKVKTRANTRSAVKITPKSKSVTSPNTEKPKK